MIAIENGHVVERAARPLGAMLASKLAERLAQDGIYVLVECGPVVHLTALYPTTTEQEVRALRVFKARTDCRLAWHGAVADV